MARRPAHFGTAQIKKREPVRPLMVLLLIAAGGILLYLWLQEDAVDPVVSVAEETSEAEETAPASRPTASAVPMPAPVDDAADWWYGVESTIYNALQSVDDARDGHCTSLEFAVSDLGTVGSRPEQEIRDSFSALVAALDDTLAACRNGDGSAVDRAVGAARGRLRTLLGALERQDVPPSTLLTDI
ncbi:MAG: hypothetical protein MPN21_09785 [Thermoanaerobaculia bacterium]|nr:hypothetical protein [Thermoanaerobaculia bacterium]